MATSAEPGGIGNSGPVPPGQKRLSCAKPGTIHDRYELKETILGTYARAPLPSPPVPSPPTLRTPTPFHFFSFRTPRPVSRAVHLFTCYELIIPG